MKISLTGRKKEIWLWNSKAAKQRPI
jgi:hypothetical protein